MKVYAVSAWEGGNDGRTRVVDFGIADSLRVEEDGERRPGRRAGTPPGVHQRVESNRSVL